MDRLGRGWLVVMYWVLGLLVLLTAIVMVWDRTRPIRVRRRKERSDLLARQKFDGWRAARARMDDDRPARTRRRRKTA